MATTWTPTMGNAPLTPSGVTTAATATMASSLEAMATSSTATTARAMGIPTLTNIIHAHGWPTSMWPPLWSTPQSANTPATGSANKLTTTSRRTNIGSARTRRETARRTHSNAINTATVIMATSPEARMGELTASTAKSTGTSSLRNITPAPGSPIKLSLKRPLSLRALFPCLLPAKLRPMGSQVSSSTALGRVSTISRLRMIDALSMPSDAKIPAIADMATFLEKLRAFIHASTANPEAILSMWMNTPAKRKWKMWT